MESDSPLTANAFEKHVYAFERRKNTRLERKKAEEARETLVRRLGLPRVAVLPRDVQDLLLKYATVCHLNISWYQAQRENEERRYRWYVILALLGVAGTPALTFVLSQFANEALTPLLTAIMAGFLATLKALGAMLEKRRLVGLFWNAEANLKADLYAFESRWTGKVFKDDGSGKDDESGEKDEMPPESEGEKREVNPDFVVDLKQRIRQAEKIRRDEQDTFFSRFDELPFDVIQVLASGTRSARSAGSSFSRTEETLSELEADIEERKRHVALLQAQLDRAKAELSNLEGDDSSLAEASRQALMDEIEQLHSLRLEAQMSLSEKLAKLGRDR